MSRLFTPLSQESENITHRKYTVNFSSFFFAVIRSLLCSQTIIIVVNASKENRINIVICRVYFICIHTHIYIRMINILFHLCVQKWRETSNNTRLPWLLIRLNFFLLFFSFVHVFHVWLLFCLYVGAFLLCSLSSVTNFEFCKRECACDLERIYAHTHSLTHSRVKCFIWWMWIKLLFYSQ